MTEADPEFAGLENRRLGGRVPRLLGVADEALVLMERGPTNPRGFGRALDLLEAGVEGGLDGDDRAIRVR